MKHRSEQFPKGELALSIQMALGLMFGGCSLVPLAALAVEDDQVAALTRPASSIEIGLRNVSDASAKFGEYDGLTNKGAKATGSFNVRGGDGNDGSNGESGTNRWSVSGTDIGTTSRELGVSVANQGKWNVSLKYDELRHAISDTYMTPFVGAMGSNVFSLPAGFGVINTTAVTGKNSQAVGTRNLTPEQWSAFHVEDVGTTRKNSSFSAGVNLDQNWSLQFEYNRLDQSGAKLIAGSSSDERTGTGAAGTWAREAMVTLMNPTNYTTNSFNVNVNWMSESSYFTGAYFGSLFSDGFDRLSWVNPMGTGVAATGVVGTTLAGGYQANMLSTAPDNQFHQLKLTGGYRIRSGTNLSGDLAYGRNTQNAAYLVDLMQPGGLPATSLSGLVVTSSANLKLTDQSFKDVALTAWFKFNERNNQTTSRVYQMFDIGGGPAVAANSGTRRVEINTPYSLRKSLIELSADYHLAKNQNLRLSYDYEDLKRWCDNVAGFAAPNPAIVGAIAGNVASPAGANCVIVPSSTEGKMGLSYRLRLNDLVNVNAAYSYAKRNATSDFNALTPLNDAAGANGTGIVNASNYKGYREFFDASRIQELSKLGLNWQAGDDLNISMSGRYTNDNYMDSVLGVQKGYSSSANIDGAWTYTENGTVSLYVTNQNRARSMKSGASGLGATTNATSYAALVAPTNIWFNSLSDRDQTIGLNLSHKGLAGGKLDLSGDASIAKGKTIYHTDVPYYVPTATGPTCDSATVLSCGDTPEIYSRNLRLKLTGSYLLDRHSRLFVSYLRQKQATNDYYYYGYQKDNTSSTLMPTNQMAPNYAVSVVNVNYLYTF